MIRIRNFCPSDSDALRQIFYRAVHEGTTAWYTPEQRAAWANAAEAPPEWPKRLGDHMTVVAEMDAQISGFMTLGYDGHLDLAFVTPESMGTGVASALHDRLLSLARAAGLELLTTEASHLARRFFLRQGWTELAAQEVELRGVSLANFRMEKRLQRLAVDLKHLERPSR